MKVKRHGIQPHRCVSALEEKKRKKEESKARPSNSRLNGINGFLLSPYIFIPRANQPANHRVFESFEKVEVYVSWHSIALLSGAINVSTTSDCYRFKELERSAAKLKQTHFAQSYYTWPIRLLLIYFHLASSPLSRQTSVVKNYLLWYLYERIE